jgi:hypothetical protein
MNVNLAGEPRDPGATGHVRLGPYALEIGDVSGTKLSFTTEEDRRQANELALALRAGESKAQESDVPLDLLDHALEETEEVTGKVERAASLLTAIAEGRVDAKSVSGEIDAMVDLLERLDREGRFKDALRLARDLSALLALLMRWLELVQTLRTALLAARAIGDLDGEAWALHELGTLALGAGDAHAAAERLGQARAVRERLGDRASLATTEENLEVARRGRVEEMGGRPPRLRGRMTIVVVSALFAAVGLAIGWVVGASGNNQTTTTLTTSAGSQATTTLTTSAGSAQANTATSTATTTLTTTTTSISTTTTTVFTTPPPPG